MCDGEDVIGRRDPLAEFPVNLINDVRYRAPPGFRAGIQGEFDDAPGDPPDVRRRTVGSIRNGQSQHLAHVVEVFLADHKLTLGVHEVDSAICGTLAPDGGSSAGRGLVAGESPDDVVNLVEDMGLQPGVPGIRFRHDALPKVIMFRTLAPGVLLRNWLLTQLASCDG